MTYVDDHSCSYLYVGLRPEAGADYVVTVCDMCGSEALFEARAVDYAEAV